jgi:predicted PurR-regulated permease PerM
VCSLFPQSRQREVLAVWEVAIDKTSSYLVSRSILALVCGTATTIFLIIARVENALVLGAFTGLVSAFVPTIGTYLGGLLPIVMAFGQSPWQGVATLAFIVAYQQVENLTIEPRISAKAMELNTAVSFLSVLAGAAILGPIGAFLALPFAATIKAFVGTYLRRNEVVENALTDLGT